MAHEDRAFRAYRARPGPDTLRALLTAHQATVYNLAFQVLRSAHDAEDAAQEALLEIVKGVAAIREPRAFKRWLCRVALHTALDHLRRRGRRARHEEARAAMKPAPPDPAADAIHEAMSRLDDDDRCLLAEKYFERATLEEIAAREGVSAAAVGKRVERAKDKLKQRLSQAGLAALVLSVDPMLEAATPAASTPDLVGTSQALDSALALAGGAVMGTKTLISATSIAIALVFLAIGSGAGYLVGARRASASTGPASVSMPDPTAPAIIPGTQVPRESKGADAADRPTAPVNVLVARLDRFRDWVNPAAESKGLEGHEARFAEARRELAGVRELILADPATFLAWIVRKENEACLGELFRVALTGKTGAIDARDQDFSSLPSGLMDGLLELLEKGSDGLKQAIFSFVRNLKNPGEGYRAQYVRMMSDPDPTLSVAATEVLLSQGGDPTSVELKTAFQLAEKLQDQEARWKVVQALARVPTPAVRDGLLDALESGRWSDASGRMAWTVVATCLAPERTPDRTLEVRAARILASALNRTTEENGYFMILWTALTLPTADWKPLFHQAAGGAPAEKLREGAAAVIEKVRAGSSTIEALQAALSSPYQAKK